MAWLLMVSRALSKHRGHAGGGGGQCCYEFTPEISSRVKGINRNEARIPRRSQMGSTHVKAQFILSVRSILGSSVFSASSVWELFYTSWQIFGLGVSEYNLSD